MDLKIKNKVAIITDGTGAIGAAIADTLAAEGATVVFAGAEDAAIERTKKALNKHSGSVVGILADAGSEADMRKLAATALDQFGRIDIVVNNAGAELYGDIGDVSVEQLSALLRIKVLGPWELARAVAPHMRKQGHGRIITVISDAGKIPGRSMIASAVGGAAQLAFVKSLADELGPSNVLATGVSIGHIKESDGPAPPVRRDPFISRSLEQHESNWAMDVPLGRWGTPSDVANAVAFLSSESSSFICGSNLDVDGGDQRSIF